MNRINQQQRVEEARASVEAGEWRRAHDLLVEADMCAPLDGPDLALLAEMAYAAGRVDLAIGTWERAHAGAVRAGDRFAAADAAVRVALHLLFDTGLMAPVRGWIKRADRLLEGREETPVHAWLAVVRSYERLLSGDLPGARAWAGLAIDVGGRCDPSAAAIGRIAQARSLILGGDVSRGVALLEDAAFAAVSGELPPLWTGVVYCEVVCAFQALAQYDLAEEWSAAMEGWHHGQPVGSIHGRCRVHRAEILRLRGSCAEAEREALLACEELRPYLRRELGWPFNELGRIRLRRGDLPGAEEAFRAAHDVGWDPQPGLALVYLARGDVALAVQSIRDALEHPPHVPSKELPPHTELRRAPLLEAQVEIEIAAGDLDRARTAADALAVIAATFESRALAAGAAVAGARVSLAEGDGAGARGRLDHAVRLWNDIGAPFEAAVARMALAQAHRTAGNEQSATLEFRAARSAFERVGAQRHAAQAARACAAGEPGHPAEGDHVFRREGDYWSVTFDGRTVRLRDRKGLRYVARLLAGPAQEVHALELVAGEAGASPDAGRGSGPWLAQSPGLAGDVFLDPQAKEAYRRRITEIDEDIEEAQVLGNEDRAAQAEAERDFLIRELARAVGLGGRDRPAGSASERARASVTRAVRHALDHIREHHPPLGEHLDRSIRTGTFCVYLPDSRIMAKWEL